MKLKISGLFQRSVLQFVASSEFCTILCISKRLYNYLGNFSIADMLIHGTLIQDNSSRKAMKEQVILRNALDEVMMFDT